MRAREAYVCVGPASLGDVELVALLLGTAAGGRSSLAIAADLVDRFGGLAGLARAEPKALERVAGVGLARAVRVHAGLEAGRRASRITARPDVVLSPNQAVRWLRPAIRDLGHEELHGLYLDRRGHPLARRRLTQGSDGFTVVDPRQVFRPAVALGAVSVILAHNHPSGDPTPSAMDREVTRRVARAGAVIGVQLADHLVIGGTDWVSMAQEGLLQGSWATDGASH